MLRCISQPAEWLIIFRFYFLQLKIKEKSTGELTAQLNSIRCQLESTTKELESVRCRAVRGGAEVERWHSDLTSLQVTNKFLSSQLNEMRAKLLAKEHFIADLTTRCREPLDVQDVTGELLILFNLIHIPSVSDQNLQ